MINLLPENYSQAEKGRKITNYLGIVLAVQLGVSGIIGVYPLKEIHEKKQYLEAINVKLSDERLREVKSVERSLEEEKANYTKWSRYLKEMKNTSFIGSNVLDTLLGNIPVGVTIDFLNIQEYEKYIEIKGKTKNTFSVMNYIAKLQTIYEETEVTFNLGEMQEDGRYSLFDIRIKWQDMEAGIYE